MLSGKPRLARAASANLAPPSPWPPAVPSTSGMPFAMIVFAKIILGFPLSFALARAIASSIA